MEVFKRCEFVDARLNRQQCEYQPAFFKQSKRRLLADREYELGSLTTQILKRCKTHHIHSHSATTIHDLPKEILCDILSRLPAKSLNTSNKLVSKFWYNLISDNKFVDAHLTRSRHQWENQQALVVKLSQPLKGELLRKVEYELMNFTQHECQLSKFEFEYELSDLEQQKSISFQSSCDGLLLFSHVNDCKELYVFNPVTRKYRVLPILEDDKEIGISDCALIYDASMQKYKVVGISDSMQTCYLYTLDSYRSSKGKAEQITNAAHWRKLVTLYKESSILSLPIVVNNELHWLASVDDSEEFIIMYTMDVSKEEFKETKIPFLTPGDWGKNTIIELMGSLCVTDYPKNLKQLDIWSLLDREKGEWTKRSIPYEFELSYPNRLLSTSIFQTRILVAHKNKIFIYDLKNKDWKTINIPGEEDICAYFVHTNSLVKWC